MAPPCHLDGETTPGAIADRHIDIRCNPKGFPNTSGASPAYCTVRHKPMGKGNMNKIENFETKTEINCKINKTKP